jgi:NADH dehydrogenase [ubiquinone] 1 alpha subcomplex assembly factor 7
MLSGSLSVTPCEGYVRNILKEREFLNIAELMAIALYHPEFGYYMNLQPLGSDADFITAPEVSILFGETICFWAVEQYYRLERPKKISLVELGPGRGILMADFLRVAQLLPEFYEALEIHCLEKSPKLKATQQYCIQHPKVFWHEDIEELFLQTADAPTLIIANEFFDALPIRQFQKTKAGWEEKVLTLSSQDTLIFKFKEISDLPFSHWQAVPNSFVEYCPLAEEIMQRIIHHLQKVSGAVLIIDYGYLNGEGDTLQSVSKHHYVSVLENLGTADITAHVNFRILKDITHQDANITTQSQFLIRHGIIRLAQAHAHKASRIEKDQLALQLYKLTSSQEMGAHFKVLELEV